jgi:GXWXG protein/Domain of unknown function (DUF4334)
MTSAFDQTEELTFNTSVLRRPSRTPNGVELELLALIEKSKRCEAVDSALIMGLYRQLEPISIKFLLGTWHGSLFNGQSGDGWWGKNMITPELVQPLLFQRENGEVYSNEVWGLAHLELGSFDTLSPTAMLKYNDKPLYDYFRRVTDETIIGLTPAALVGGEADFFFQLTRDHTTKVVA